MSKAIALEARVADLENGSLSTETLRDILCDMLELEPAEYSAIATDLCFKIFDLTGEIPRTMSDFMEAKNR